MLPIVAASSALLVGAAFLVPRSLTSESDAAIGGPDPAAQIEAPTSRPAPPARRIAPVVQDPTIVLLDELEASARTLESFTAAIHYETEDAFLGQRVVRKGNIVYCVDPSAGDKSFAIMFDVMIEGRRKFDQEKEYVFGDGWLVERDREAKQFVKRQIVRPGEQFDPLKLGEGPIPLPIGQSRKQVLERFSVALIDLPNDGPLARLRGKYEVDGVRLFPRPGTEEADDYTRIDLFYDKVTRLPVGINLVEKNGDRKTARLSDVVRNAELDAKALASIDISVPDNAAEWHIDVRPLE